MNKTVVCQDWMKQESLLWNGKVMLRGDGCSLHMNLSDLEKFVFDYYVKPEFHLVNQSIPQPGINATYYVKVDDEMYARISESECGIKIGNIEDLGSFATINQYKQMMRNKLRRFLTRLV